MKADWHKKNKPTNYLEILMISILKKTGRQMGGKEGIFLENLVENKKSGFDLTSN